MTFQHFLSKVATKQSELGIGQANLADYRYEVVDFLPPMYLYEYIMKTKRPDQIDTYDTIVYPFDAYIWIFILFSMMAQLLALFVMQNVWSITSGAKKPRDYIFEGSNQTIHMLLYT